MAIPRSSSVVYRFGEFELQGGERRLLAAGMPVNLGPRGFDLLVALVERAGHLVTKDELFAFVWPKVIVDDSALQFQVSALRKVVGAEAIATVSGRGYRFVLEVARHGGDGHGEAGAPRHNLPPPSSSFVGREGDLARLNQSLDRARLVTLTGAGGCGKTRLAVRVAADVLARYPDGVWFVDLAPLADPALLPRAVMAALDLRESTAEDRTKTLVAHLASRRPLLVLDNAEHVLAAAAELADVLLRDCRGVGLLVTSRERLGIAGELTYRVPPLSMPDPKQPTTVELLEGCDSAQLFVERARLLRPHFAVTPQNAGAVALVCAQLDGIPLAIELAAGRMRSMSVDELAQRLHQRFSLLASGTGTALPRHRTLRSLIDWSYDLLDADEQALLCRLSVFAGGCTLGAAEQVCADDGDPSRVLDLLASLADKNLLVVDDQPGATRYRLLETVRQYAAERLREGGHAPVWTSRHLTHFAALAGEAEPHLGGADQRLWFERLDAEIDNLRAALACAASTEHAGPTGLRLATALGRFWQMRGHLLEARSWYSTLLAMVPADAPAPELTLSRANALNMAGAVAGQLGDNAAAKVNLDEALGLYRALGDERRTASVLNNLGICAQHDADYALAATLYRENIAILRTIPHGGGLSRSLHNLGDLMQLTGDRATAKALLEESVGVAREHGDRYGMSMSLGTLGLIAAQEGRYEEARAAQVQGLALELALGSQRAIAYSLEALAFVESSTGERLRAAQLWGAAQALRESVGHAMPQNERPDHLRRIAEVRAALADDEAFDRAWREGAAMTLEQAVRHASQAPAACVSAGPVSARR